MVKVEIWDDYGMDMVVVWLWYGYSMAWKTGAGE